MLTMRGSDFLLQHHCSIPLLLVQSDRFVPSDLLLVVLPPNLSHSTSTFLTLSLILTHLCCFDGFLRFLLFHPRLIFTLRFFCLFVLDRLGFFSRGVGFF